MRCDAMRGERNSDQRVELASVGQTVMMLLGERGARARMSVGECECECECECVCAHVECECVCTINLLGEEGMCRRDAWVAWPGVDRRVVDANEDVDGSSRSWWWERDS
jgi:hypothetical protein